MKFLSNLILISAFLPILTIGIAIYCDILITLPMFLGIVGCFLVFVFSLIALIIEVHTQHRRIR